MRVKNFFLFDSGYFILKVYSVISFNFTLVSFNVYLDLTRLHNLL